MQKFFKFGIRKNMRYPLLLILFQSLQEFDEMFMRILCEYYKEYFICCTLIFLSQFLSGLIPLLIQGKGEIKIIALIEYYKEKIAFNILIMLKELIIFVRYYYYYYLLHTLI